MFWRRRKIAKTLPYPEGPYGTGCIDFIDSYGKDSLFIRFTYPTDVDPDEVKQRRYQFVSWLPNEKYLEAFAKLLNLWLIILKIVLWFMGGEAYIPTLWQERVSSKVKKCPIVIFSHGYGSTRFLCSTVCNELASRGYIVAAIEHKDMSASVTYYYESEEHQDRGEKKYILAQPFNVETADHFVLRNEQLKKRSRECIRTLDLMEKINDGKAFNVEKSEFDIMSLKGKIDMKDPIIIGHSFGGATAMYTLSKDPRFKVGIILDGWMFPIKSENLKISQPMLFINTHTFHLEVNIKLMKIFSDLPNNVIFTMRDTTHESNTDTPLIYGHWLNLFMKKLPSKTALRIQNYLIFEFLYRHLGVEIDINVVENYLRSQNSVLVNDFIRYSTVPMKKFSIFRCT